MTFGSRLTRAMEDRGRSASGIDPHAALLDDWGLTDSVVGLERFALTAVEALRRAVVAVVKPQSAFFERFGSPRDRGARAGRSTAAASAARWCCSTSSAATSAPPRRRTPTPTSTRPRRWPCDAITASPYLGFGSLDPLIDTALRQRRRRVRARADLQPGGPAGAARASPPDGRTVAGAGARRGRHPQRRRRRAGLDRRRGRRHHRPPTDIGAEHLDVNGPLLVPGIGAQGGTVDDVRRIFGAGLPPRAAEQLAGDPRRRPRQGPRCTTPCLPGRGVVSTGRLDARRADSARRRRARLGGVEQAHARQQPVRRRRATCRSRSRPSTGSGTSTTGPPSTPASPSSAPRSRRSPPTRRAADLREHHRGAGAVRADARAGAAGLRPTCPRRWPTDADAGPGDGARAADRRAPATRSASTRGCSPASTPCTPAAATPGSPPSRSGSSSATTGTSSGPVPRCRDDEPRPAARAQHPDHHPHHASSATGCSPRPTTSRCTSPTGPSSTASPTTSWSPRPRPRAPPAWTATC